ncbi:hypothetical protein BaRGS_00034561, partial [Batillaria attramentaria]
MAHHLLFLHLAVLFFAMFCLIVARGQMVAKVILGPFQEQQRAGVLVGNIARESNIASEVSASEFNKLRYEFLDPSNLQTASLFTLNGQTGGIYTSAMIDREAVCEFQEECLIKFDVTVSSEQTAFLRIVNVAINITDVNDNVPTFPRDNITLDIPEGTYLGTTLLTTTDAVKLKVDRNLDNSFKVSLVVNKNLDREQRDKYLVRVKARDGGLQSLTGTLTVNINVADVNDNAPVFSQRSYSYSVVENAPPNMTIGRVYATDLDAGMNARITYSFSEQTRSKLQELFAIDPDRGEIKIIKPLQFVSGNEFNAIVEAKDNGFPAQQTQAQLNITILDVGNNAPQVEFVPKNPLYGQTVLVAENARTPYLVGTLRVEDNDPGVNGIVNCGSSHGSFKVQKLEGGGGFLVLLQSPLDREHEEKVNVTITCADSGAPSMSRTTMFNVIVADANDNPPVFTQHVYVANLTEDSEKDKEIIRVTAHDIDKGMNGQFYYYLHPRKNVMFNLNSETGVLTSNMVFDREVSSEVTVTVKAIDEGDQSLTGTATIVVHILDKNDNAPELETKEFHIVEGNEPDRYVGKLKAHDADVGINAEVEFYMKVATPLPPFIVYPDGQIRTRQNMDIDRELQDRYQFEVYMNDKGSPKQSSSAMVTVHILDVNDNSPEVIFPTSKNGTVRIMWDQKPRVPFAQIYASDPDDGMNSKLYFFIAGSNKNNLFEVDKDRGLVSLSRYIQANDNFFQRVKIAVQDQGNPQLETQAQLIVRIDTTNATFAPTRRPRPVKHNLARDWQRDKMGIQEECGKTEMEKVAWKASHGGKALPDPEDVDDDPDICDGPSDHVTMGKVVSLPWSNEKGGGGGSDGHVMHGPLDQYRKQDFYTFCKVRSPHDDVNSVTSGETTTSDSGRGGSEDDTPLPPIAEVPPESSAGLPINSTRPNQMARQDEGKFQSGPTLPGCHRPRFGVDSQCAHARSLLFHYR